MLALDISIWDSPFTQSIALEDKTSDTLVVTTMADLDDLFAVYVSREGKLLPTTRTEISRSL